MKLRIFFVITLAVLSLNTGLAKAQTSITNNSGSSGLYSISGTSYYQSPASQQQSTYNVNQSANGLILQNQISGVTIDPSSAPPFSTQQKTNNKYKIFGYLAILLVIFGAVVLVFGFLNNQPAQVEAKEPKETPKEPKPESSKAKVEAESKTEEVKEEKTKDKPKKKRKNKKHHR